MFNEYKKTICFKCLGCNQLENKYFQGLQTCKYFRASETTETKKEYIQKAIKGVQDATSNK